LVTVGVLPDGGSATEVAGGVTHLAALVASLRASAAHSVVVSAGDLIGGTPFLSKAFHDEPTVMVMNALGLDIAGVGNHEFDEGLDELLRLQAGQCRSSGCFDAGVTFSAPRFEFVGANVRRTDGGAPLARYAVRSYGGVKVAFIGLTLEGTAGILAPKGSAGLRFDDEVATVNVLVPELRAQGIKAIVVLLHEGSAQVPSVAVYNQCAGLLPGPLADIIEALDPEVDLVITGHTHAAYSCECRVDAGCAAPLDATLRGRRVTSALSFGRLVTDFDVTLSATTGEVVAIRQDNLVVRRDAGADDGVRTLVEAYERNSASVRLRPVGLISATLSATAADAGEVPLGLVIADAQLAATRAGGSRVAFMNAGGVRADLVYRDAGTGTSVVTYEDLFGAQPFGNLLMSMDLTGEQLYTLLDQQFQPPRPRMLQVSSGFTFAYEESAAGALQIDRSSVLLDGVALSPDGVYRITANNFIAGGGDGYRVLKEGRNVQVSANDLDALEAYFGDAGVVGPPALGRVRAR
jgi:5'-nucleotidase